MQNKKAFYSFFGMANLLIKFFSCHLFRAFFRARVSFRAPRIGNAVFGAKFKVCL